MMSAGVWAHSGGTDRQGCHVDHKNGGRHCH
ncbi:YHYH domain-containing protein [Variovorax sp. WS11]|nr:YHYH domain-containing protein [Variovorax sp. WS11]